VPLTERLKDTPWSVCCRSDSSLAPAIQAGKRIGGCAWQLIAPDWVPDNISDDDIVSPEHPQR
jgi:hypothetical protein